MSTPRYCEFWKASDGKWYLNLAVHEEVLDFDDDFDDEDGSYRRSSNQEIDGTYEDSITYGPFPSEKECESYLDNFSNPGSFYTDDSGKKPPPTKSPNGSPVERVGSFSHRDFRASVPRSTEDMISSAQAAASRVKQAAVAANPAAPKKTSKVYGGKTLKGPAGSTRKVPVHTRLNGKAYGPDKSRFKKGDSVSVKPSTYAGFAKDNKTPYQIAVNDPDGSGKDQFWNVDKGDIGESVLRQFVTEVLKNKK